MLSFLLPLLASGTPFFVAYDLSVAAQIDLTQKGCYRGLYGGVFPNTFSLITCPSTNSTLIGEFPESANLCVLELGSPRHAAHVQAVISQHSTSKVVFAGRQEIVVLDVANVGLPSDLCFVDKFDFGAVSNARFVPTSPILPQKPMPTDHPAVKKWLKREEHPLKADPIIANMVARFTQANVETFLADLSQNDGNNLAITRNSYSISVGRGGCASSAWKCVTSVQEDVVNKINEWFANYPGEWNIELHQFRNDMCPNIILTIPSEKGNLNDLVVLGAHIDSRNTNSGPTASGVAPGADDNGTGSAVLLEMARVIASAPEVAFTYTLSLEWYCGEEQGLLGSAALAERHLDERRNVVGMFNNDMIGYANGAVVMAFMTRSATAWLSQSCKEFVGVYVSDLATGDTTSCCSDQQSYYSRGFPAAGIFETPTSSVVYPQYHKQGDTFDNGIINFKQVWQFGQGNLACILEYAVPFSAEPSLTSIP